MKPSEIVGSELKKLIDEHQVPMKEIEYLIGHTRYEMERIFCGDLLIRLDDMKIILQYLGEDEEKFVERIEGN